MVALIDVAASLGKITIALLSFGGGGPLRWRLGKNSRHASSSSSSWSGEEIIRATIRHEAQMSSSSSSSSASSLFNTDPTLLLRTQALLKKYKVMQQKHQQADLNQQQSMLKQQRQNDTGTTTSSASDDDMQRSFKQQQQQQPSPHKFSRRLTVNVCLSPGCIADGAAVTLEKLQSLAPAHVRIQQGGCSSFCGSGPVVVTVLEEQAPSSPGRQQQRPVLVEQKSHKRILNDKILQLVYPTAATATAESDDQGQEQSTTAASSAIMIGPPPDLVQGYDLVLRGDALYANKEFSKAMECYEEAVRVAFTSAVELQNERDRFHSFWASQHHHEEEEQQQQEPDNDSNDEDNDGSENVEDTSAVMGNDDSDVTKTSVTTTTTTTRIPVELEWLIRARRNEARCKLELGNDIEGAVLAAQAACNLSRNTSGESFHVLAEVYKCKQDLMGEMQALQRMLSLPPPWSSSSSTNTAAVSLVRTSQRQQQFAMENQRRIASIRLQKLEREYQIQIKRP